jgi:hypothetical protein
MLGSRQMGESVAPSSENPAAVESAAARAALGRLERELGELSNGLGVLRNGLGSIRNLELLIKSIKVGQKGLFAAVSAVHADCAPMIAQAVAIGRGLSKLGVEPGCAERLSSALALCLTGLERMLASSVESGRLSTARRLELERDLARCARELSSTLPLISLIERASRPRPLELTPVALLHASSAARSDESSVVVLESPSPSAAQCGLNVDLEVAKTLVALAVALVLDGNPEGAPRLGFELAAGGMPVSSVWLGPARSSELPGSGAPCLHVPALRLSAQSVLCAEVAARSLGGRLEYARDARRVCIYWPLS